MTHEQRGHRTDTEHSDSPLRTVQVEPEAQAVGPVQPWPPHWPYFWATAVLAGADDEAEADETDEECDAEEADVADEPDALPVGALPPGTAVGTVEGWRAVFHVAVVGHAVVATVGDVLSYGLGPGTRRVIRICINVCGLTMLTSVGVQLLVDVDEDTLET